MTVVLLVSDDDDLKARFESIVSSLEGYILLKRPLPTNAGNPERDAKEIASSDPLIVVFDGSHVSDYVLEIAGALDRMRPDIGLAVIARHTRTAWEGALRAGVRELLAPADDDNSYAEALQRLAELAQRRRSEMVVAEPQGVTARVIVVVSPKGGAGKTMLATNLAMGLARVVQRGVVIVDIDLQFGDVGNALRLTPDKSIADAVHGGLVDGTAIKLNLTTHPSGLFALTAPEDPGEADDINAEHIARAINLLSAEFPWIVLDTDPGLGEHTLAAIERATDLVFVCGTDVASVRGLRKELAALDRIGMSYQQRHFVLNRADARVGLSADDISSAIAMPIDVFVPSSRTVPLAMNQGVSLLESEEQSPVQGPLWQLVNRFVPMQGGDHAPPPPEDRKGRLRRR